MKRIIFAALLTAFTAGALACVPTREWCYPCEAGKVHVCQGAGLNERCYCVPVR